MPIGSADGVGGASDPHDPAAISLAQQLEHIPLVLAPEWMLTEVANALWTLQRACGLAGVEPQLLLADARDLVDQIEPDRHLHAEALAFIGAAQVLPAAKSPAG